MPAREKREPYLWEALLSLVSLIIGIMLSIVVYGTDPHIPMLLGVFVAAVVAYRAGYAWDIIQAGMLKGITNALQAIIILLIIGILIGVWILSCVVPTLLYYGLKILTPEIFLPAAVLISAVTSLATGTSWGTTGTIGVALMGIGAGLGFPLPLVAGAVLSGAYFGDKMSPLSDTTNLAPAMAGTDIYTHIRHMTYTSGVAFGLTLIIEIALGLFYGGGEGEPGRGAGDHRHPVSGTSRLAPGTSFRPSWSSSAPIANTLPYRGWWPACSRRWSWGSSSKASIIPPCWTRPIAAMPAIPASRPSIP